MEVDRGLLVTALSLTKRWGEAAVVAERYVAERQPRFDPEIAALMRYAQIMAAIETDDPLSARRLIELLEEEVRGTVAEADWSPKVDRVRALLEPQS